MLIFILKRQTITSKKLVFGIVLTIAIFSSNLVISNNTLAQITTKFLWGAATSSYQTEGGINNNDWDKFTKNPDIRDRIYKMTDFSPFYKDFRIYLQPPRDAVKTWDPKYYEKDFDLAREMGMNSFRIGLEWSRIEPQKGVWNQTAINDYKDMIKSMRQKGLTPIVTLNHFTLPSWVLTPPTYFVHPDGSIRTTPISTSFPSFSYSNKVYSKDPYWNSLRGWENPQTVDEFIKYVSKVVPELKDQVDYWLTINEPVGSTIGVGYFGGLWSPGFFADGERGKAVLHNLIMAHVRAYDTITELDNVDADDDGIAKRVGFAHAMLKVEPSNPSLGGIFGDNSRAAKNFDYFTNDYFLNAVINGEEDLNYLNTLQIHNTNSNNFIIHDKPGDDWRNKVDFVGLNYYRKVHVFHSSLLALTSARYQGGIFQNNLINSTHQPHDLLNDLGWEIYPQGLYDIIMKIKNQWNKPVLITENGIADNDDKFRAQYIISHLQQVKRAIDDGANVLGYIYWSLMDNFEWADNYKPESKFGLFSIDRNGRESITNPFMHFGFFGGNGDDVINAGSTLPNSNCTIDDVILELVNKHGVLISTTSNGKRDANGLVGLSHIGARITESHENTGNLETKVHWFYDPGAALRYKIHYFFKGDDCNNDGKPDFDRQKTRGVDALESIIKGSNNTTINELAVLNASKKFGSFTSDDTLLIAPQLVNPQKLLNIVVSPSLIPIDH